ncbi:MAG: twin-arginine translocase subunit TatC [Gammaproteobacteria bacterium]|nr:twin-arginine translocase subunit TatC [Gammaproteobacteria bacterium]
MTDPKQYPPPNEQPLVQHLLELRDRLMRIVLVIIILFLALFAFANDLYTYLAEPLLRHMAEGTSMIATQVVSPFLTPFKLALVMAIFIAVPFILYQAWGFMAPGLYQHEKKLVYPLLLSSTILFYAGMAFAYYVVFPLVFGFLTGIAPEGVAVTPDITYYLDFAIKMFFAFGLAFEVPIATILVVWSGISTAEKLAAKRPYVGAFVFAMLLTPPDVISQTLLAIPMWILFELGLVFSRFYAKPEEEENSIAGDVTPASPPTAKEAGVTVATATASVSTAAESRTEPVATDPENEQKARPDDVGYGDIDDYEDTNNSGHGEYEPPTEAELDAELDRLEAEENAEEAMPDEQSNGQTKPGDDKQT